MYINSLMYFLSWQLCLTTMSQRNQGNWLNFWMQCQVKYKKYAKIQFSAELYLPVRGETLGNDTNHVTPTNVGTIPKTFWLLVLTLLSHWCKFSRSYLVPVSNYWIWTKITPKKSGFSGPYKIKVMITSLIEMLELPNFGHMTKSAT